VILPRIADAARRLCGSDTASIFLREAGAELMVPRFRVGEFPPAYEGLRIARGQGLGGQAWRTGRPARTADYERDAAVPEHFRDVARQSGVRAVMAVPIQIGPEVEGLLYVGNRLARPFTDEEERACVWLANQAAVALQNAALFERERRLRVEAEPLAALASYLTASLDLPRVLGAIAEAVRDITGADLVCEPVAPKNRSRSWGPASSTARWSPAARSERPQAERTRTATRSCGGCVSARPSRVGRCR
jgi:transcriptional regulator with GAF, ATPase, and Fis domain